MRCSIILLLLGCVAQLNAPAFAEPQLLGAQKLRELVLDAQFSNLAAVRKGHWKGKIYYAGGINPVGEYMDEGGGELELIWDGKTTYGKHRFIIDYRTTPNENGRPTEADEFIVKNGVHWRHDLNNHTLCQQPEIGNFNQVNRRARMRPDQIWFRMKTNSLWSKLLSVDNDTERSQLLKSEVSQSADGLIHIRHDYSTSFYFECDADPKQGFNIVRWNGNNKLNYHANGTTTWKQTAGGAWYPEVLEYENFPPGYDDRPEVIFKLTTSSFDDAPTIPKDRFNWRKMVPPGTPMQVRTGRGKILKVSRVGTVPEVDPNTLLEKLGEKAKTGFADPNRGKK